VSAGRTLYRFSEEKNKKSLNYLKKEVFLGDIKELEKEVDRLSCLLFGIKSIKT